MLLTDERFADEVAFIERYQAWPCWPVLPVKNMNRGNPGFAGGEGIGIMLNINEEVPTKVWLINILRLTTGPILDQIKDVQVLEFDSIEYLVRAGWVAD